MPIDLENKVRGRSQGTGVGTNAGVTVTLTGAAGTQFSVRSIDCSGDAAAVVTIESPAGTVKWQKRFAAAFNTAKEFDLGSLLGADGSNILVKISASTSNCEANISADKLPGAL